MEKLKCDVPKLSSKFSIYLYFWIGVFGAIGIRAAKLVDPFSPIAGKLIWYAAVVGYIFFFWHRLKISKQRRKVVSDYSLLEKVREKKLVDDVDYKALNYLLTSVDASKERWNYTVIIIFSFVAVAIGLITDFNLIK